MIVLSFDLWFSTCLIALQLIHYSSTLTPWWHWHIYWHTILTLTNLVLTLTMWGPPNIYLLKIPWKQESILRIMNHSKTRFISTNWTLYGSDSKWLYQKLCKVLVMSIDHSGTVSAAGFTRKWPSGKRSRNHGKSTCLHKQSLFLQCGAPVDVISWWK